MSLTRQISNLATPAKLIAVFLLISLPAISFGQLPSYQRTNGSSIFLNGTIYLDDLFKNNSTYRQYKDPDIKGSPFLVDEWKNADLEMKDGKVFKNVKVKLNLYTQEFICMSSSKNEFALKDGI